MTTEDPGSALYMRVLEEYDQAVDKRSTIEVELEGARRAEEVLRGQVDWLVGQLYPDRETPS